MFTPNLAVFQGRIRLFCIYMYIILLLLCSLSLFQRLRVQLKMDLNKVDELASALLLSSSLSYTHTRTHTSTLAHAHDLSMFFLPRQGQRKGVERNRGREVRRKGDSRREPEIGLGEGEIMFGRIYPLTWKDFIIPSWLHSNIDSAINIAKSEVWQILLYLPGRYFPFFSRITCQSNYSKPYKFGETFYTFYVSWLTWTDSASEMKKKCLKIVKLRLKVVKVHRKDELTVWGLV